MCVGVSTQPTTLAPLKSLCLPLCVQVYLGVGQGNVRGGIAQGPVQRDAEEEDASFATPAPTGACRRCGRMCWSFHFQAHPCAARAARYLPTDCNCTCVFLAEIAVYCKVGH